MVATRTGQIPLWMAAALAGCLVLAVGIWTWRSTRNALPDGRTPIVFWAGGSFGDDIYTAVYRFERENPRYKVILGTAAARDMTGDAQRLLSAIAGNVPPDVVWFDRFAVGEWAARNALTDLTPLLDAQAPDDPYRIDLNEFYKWVIDEASYARPLSGEPQRIYGIPTSADIRVLFVNSDHLRQAGLVDEAGQPRPPRTWEELREYSRRLTRYDDKGNLVRLGFAPNYGNSWLYIYAWQAGGEFMNPDRTRVTMDSPPVVRALRFMSDVYDDYRGGYEEVEQMQSAFVLQQGVLDPFINGKVSMKIDGDWILPRFGDWKPNMDFLTVPAPLPADRLAAGHQPVTWAGGWALVIPSTAKNKAGAWKLIQFMSSWKTVQLLEQGIRERKLAEGRMYLPSTKANRVHYERLVKQYVDDNPAVPPRIRQGYAVIKDMLPRTLIRPVTPVGQLLWNQHQVAYENGVRHRYAAPGRDRDEEMRLALADAQVIVQEQLDQILQPPPPTVVNWRPYFAMYATLVVVPFALMVAAYHRRKRQYAYKAREVGAAMLFASPWIAGFVLFVGGPIVFSIIFSFTRYDVLSPARYVGLGNYAAILSDPFFFKSLGNTAFMALRIPVVMAVSLMIAMLLNRAIGGLGVYRTIFYMPAIVPLVASSLLWLWLFDKTGALTVFVQWLLATPPLQAVQWMVRCIPGLADFTFAAPRWLQSETWSKPSLILMNLWAAGGGMIIWLAGLQSIPPQLYEAASIDGAGPWRRFRHVTLPMLSPYILFNSVVGLIHTLQIFAEAYIMTPDGKPGYSTLFYAYHLFNQAFRYFRMGYASALAWILFILVLSLTLLQLWLSKKWVHYERS